MTHNNYSRFFPRLVVYLASGMILAAAPIATITVSKTAVPTATANLTASVPSQTGVSYFWKISNGAITSNLTNTNAITFGVGQAGTTTLTCAVTDSNGPSTTGTCKISVVDPPNVTITSPTIVGMEKTVTASVPAQPGASYSWSVGYGTILGAKNQNQVTFKTGTTYACESLRCKVTNALGDYLQGAKILQVIKPPQLLSVTGSGHINSASGECSPNVRAGTDHLVYLWVVGGRAHLLSGTAPLPYDLERKSSNHPGIMIESSANTGETFPITCTVTDFVGQQAAVTGIGYVRAGGNMTAPPTWVTPGDSGLSGYIERARCDTYVDVAHFGEWNGEHLDIKSQDSYSCLFDVKMDMPTYPIPYKLVATNVIAKSGYSCETENRYPIISNSPAYACLPPIAPITAPALTTEGTDDLRASVPYQYTGGYPTRYLWSISNGWITSGLGGNEIRYQVAGPGLTQLSCKVINFADRSIVGSFTTHVYPVPKAPITVPCLVETSGTTGRAASVPAQAGASYSWGISGGTITAGAGTNAITYKVTDPDGGNVRLTCTVTNAAGKMATGVQSVSVVAPPSITSFTATVNPVVVGNPTTDSITPVFRNGKGAVDQGIGEVISGRSYDISPAAPTKYTLTVTNSAGTKITQPLTVTVNPGFYPTGSMLLPRENHESVLLENGNVLVGGGDNGTYAMVATDVYNGFAFTATGAMDLGRSEYAATRLSNGNVLFSGGFTILTLIPNAVESTSLFNGTIFNPASSMTSARRGHTSTMLLDGRVLVVGGQNSGSDYLGTAGVFDGTGSTSFTATANSLTRPRTHHTATLLPNGKVLVYGGQNASDKALGSAQFFNPSSGAFEPEITTLVGGLGPLPVRTDHQATLLPGGQVFFSGGKDASGGYIATLLLFDPILNGFVVVSPIGMTPRAKHTATLLPNGNVLLAGGMTTGGVPTDTAEVFDPFNNTITKVANMTAGARSGHKATLLNSNKVLITGGKQGDTVTSSAELYDMAATTPGAAILIFSAANTPTSGGSTQILPVFLGSPSATVTLDGLPFATKVISGKLLNSGALSTGMHTFTLKVGSTTQDLKIIVP